MSTLHNLEKVYSKNICFRAIQNGGKSNKLLQAWTEVTLLAAEKCNPCEIYRTMCNINAQVCFSKKNLYKWAKHRIVTTSWSKKDSYGGGNMDSLIKKKFQAQQSVKKVMLTVFWNMNRPITTDLFEKAGIVNGAFYCQLLRQNSSNLLNDLCTSII